MKFFRSLPVYLPVLVILLTSCKYSDKKKEDKMKEPNLIEENISYIIDSLKMDGYVVYDDAPEGKRPAVLVVHEWWGLNDYSKMRARELAKLGYIAMAVDMYGNGKRGNDPVEAQNLAMPFYQDPQLAKKHFDAALNKLKTYPMVDTTKIAAIGYCFGGGILLNLARMGEDLKGVVSFHGSLIGTPADKNLLKAKILVCHGNDDEYVKKEEVEKFRHQMDSIGASYIFKDYDGATHAFSNPNATELGKKFSMSIAYNAAADTASWNEMKIFFNKLFQ
jgi:dienelactone hydrolase